MDEQQPPSYEPIPPDEAPEPTPNEFVRTIEPVQQAKKKRRLSLIIGLVLLLLLGGGAAYFITKHKQPPTSNGPTSQASEPPKALLDTTTKRYSSSQFYLDIDLPSDWEVKDEQGSGIMTATSPNIAIPTAGTNTTGRVVLTLRDKSQKLTEFDKGNATATIDSEKIAYTKPSSAQRGQTYVSFLTYATATSTSLIDGIYITGDFGYQKEQAIPKVDIQKIDPIISLTFMACDGSCTKQIAITPDAWQAADFGVVLKKMLQSLTVN